MIVLDVLKNLFSRAFTVKYPEKKPGLPERFKGKHIWEEKMCIYCFQCQAQCPTKAIHIDKEKKTYTVDLGRCIFCGLCEEVCPTGAIRLGKKYELAVTKKENVVKKL